MHNSPLASPDDLRVLRDFIARLPAPSLVDFDEQIQLASVRATMRLWRQDQQVVGLAYVDDYDNLWFETLPGFALLGQLEQQIIAWGVACIKERNAHTLDCSCRAADTPRIQALERLGFERQAERTLRYARSLSLPVIVQPLPQGFWLRPTQGEGEVERLVGLHRAAFGTEQMTVEQRLAIMRAPQYLRELDLVVVAPGGELAAFCVCGLADPVRKTGYTDPIGTHHRYRRLGLAKAVVSAGLAGLRDAGAEVAELGTGSENQALQRLAASLGYICVEEKLWFSKAVA